MKMLNILQNTPITSYSSYAPPYGQPLTHQYPVGQPVQYSGNYSTGTHGTVEHYSNTNNYSTGGTFPGRQQQKVPEFRKNQQKVPEFRKNQQRQNVASNPPRQSNLIVINTVPMKGEEKSALKTTGKNITEKSDSTKPALIRPQDKWALTDEDSQSSTPTRTKG